MDQGRYSRERKQKDLAKSGTSRRVRMDDCACRPPKYPGCKSAKIVEAYLCRSDNSKSKWTGKSSSTIFDKLRADFSSSKTVVNRVAQVRITETGKPSGALSPSEIEEQWQELVDSLKVCILQSFNTRVSQYEEDIKEREGQRSLPGWNFCTFFILKEGLAKGFENVGLLEDALAVYDELEVGLDAVVKDSDAQSESDSPGALLPYSKDLKTIIRKALDQDVDPNTGSNGVPDVWNLDLFLDSDRHQYPFDIDRRRYRELILSNNVSALDLRIYMFTKRMEILLRKARLPSPAALASKQKGASIDLIQMSAFAETALDFINLACRQLRADLHSAWGGRLSGRERRLQKIIISNLVGSWAWAAIAQVLNVVLPNAGLDLQQLQD